MQSIRLEPIIPTAMKLEGRDIRLLAGFELRQLFRSAQGVLALCFLAIWVGWVLSKLVGNAGLINNLSSGSLDQEQVVLLEALKWILGIEDETLSRMFIEHSPFVAVLFFFAAFGMPFLTMIAGLDQNATDIGSKGIRFLLPRTSRDNLLVGRFLGTLCFWSVAIVLAGAAGTVTALLVDNQHGPADILLDGLWFSFGLGLVALPFVAFMALCSVTTGNPLLAATMGLGTYFAVALLGGLGGWIHEGLKVIRFVFPAPLRYDLMLGSAGDAIISAAAMVLYALLYLFGARWIFRQRDL